MLTAKPEGPRKFLKRLSKNDDFGVELSFLDVDPRKRFSRDSNSPLN